MIGYVEGLLTVVIQLEKVRKYIYPICLMKKLTNQVVCHKV